MNQKYIDEDANANANEDTHTHTHTHTQLSPHLRSWPEDIDRDATGCGTGRWAFRVWNNLTYSYMNELLKKGASQNRTRSSSSKPKPTTKRADTDDNDKSEQEQQQQQEQEQEQENIHLTSDDLFPVPRQMRSSRLVHTFESCWEKNSSIERNQQKQQRDGKDDNSDHDNDHDNDHDHNSDHSSDQYKEHDREQRLADTRRLFLKSLWKVALPTFFPAGLYELVCVIVVSTMPLIVRRFLRVLEENENVLREGLGWSFLLTASTFVNGLATQRYRHQAFKSGIALKSATINIVYQHVLRLSPAGKRGLTAGEINNLVAVDAQKLYEVTQEAHLVWALPLSVALVTWFLCLVMGPVTLVGVLVLVAFLPIIKLVTKQMIEVRAKRVKLSDERVEITVSMLLGMRTTKLNGYESKYQARLEAVRKKELHFLAREQAWWATTLLMTVCSPVLATALTFATYVLTPTEDDPHLLTAADTFGVLLLFGALRFPINFAGKLIGNAAQALSAIRRIVVFLERPLREEPLLLLDNNDNDNGKLHNNKNNDNDNENSIPLVLTKARFRVGIPSDDSASISSKNNNNIASNAAAAAAAENDETETMASTASNGGTRDNLSFTVGNFDFELRRGEVMVVCGPVGSGKSTLLNGILEEAEELPLSNLNFNELPPSTTISMVQKSGRISYAPQDPFILNLTLRDNILFGSDFDSEWYNKVLDACALRPDIEQLGGSDLIQIGERGVTLSGGQRQRVSLARAAYKVVDSAIVILDDPFSALDSGTGKVVFERLIASPNALLKNSAVLLVTHASHFISHEVVDKILLMVNGRNEFLGTWEELTTFNDEEHNEQTRRAVDHIQSQVREDITGEEKIVMKKSGGDNGDETMENENENKTSNPAAVSSDTANEPTKSKQGQNKLMQKELREHGLSSMKTWLLWFKRAGGAWFGITVVVLMAIDRSAYVAVEWFLAMWATGAYEPVNILGIEFPAQTDGLSAQSTYLRVFFVIILISILSTALRSEFAVTGGVRATKNVFNSMLGSVLKAPMTYFETVPMGRILNRFTYDTDVNDVLLTQVISMFIISCSWYTASIAVQVAILPWSALALFPISGLYLVFMHYYRMTGPDLQRIDALSRSPMQSMVSECLEGSTSIRVFQQDGKFIRRFEGIVDVNSSALLNYVSVQRWLSVRMEVLGSVVVLTTTVLVVSLNDTLQTSAGLAGLLITWGANFTITLNFLVQTFSETEAAITAIERVDAMADLPTEKSMETADEFKPPPEWPEKGLLEFRDVSLRYREGLPLALNGLSFSIPAGKTCGIVGRTGAGKSSITVALFRLVEIEPDAGSILLDGIDLTKLGLSDVRGRGMSIIPQDPFLAGATLRECLDPFEQRSDSEILEALESVRMGLSNTNSGASSSQSSQADIFTISPETLLMTKLEEGGSNYSVGERQLLNLARALLSQPRVLVLDEATASIDGETDAFIQKMIRTRFPHTTLLTIAHRLNTIMDYDCVLVMDSGKAAEFDAPAKLLEKEEGIFSQLVDATGSESSRALRELAIESWEAKQQ